MKIPRNKLVPWIRVVRDRVSKYKPSCQTPYGVAVAVLEEVGDAITESLYVVCVDAKSKAIAICEVAKGGVDAMTFTAADVLRPAIATGARAIILAHNHPSGNVKPSPDDLRATVNIKNACEIIGIPLLDHVIIGSALNHYSMFEHGDF